MYVGNSSWQRSRAHVPLVHPHVYGELTVQEQSSAWIYSSYPRMWGTPERRRNRLRAHRFIPTCVGNSRSRTGLSNTRSVHPHIRGELVGWTSIDLGSSGSSPHAWGTPDLPCRGERDRRFIPTCVGNSPCHRPRRCKVPVHPHMRGELRMV